MKLVTLLENTDTAQGSLHKDAVVRLVDAEADSLIQLGLAEEFNPDAKPGESRADKAAKARAKLAKKYAPKATKKATPSTTPTGTGGGKD